MLPRTHVHFLAEVYDIDLPTFLFLLPKSPLPVLVPSVFHWGILLTSQHEAKAVAFLVERHLDGFGNNASTALWH